MMRGRIGSRRPVLRTEGRCPGAVTEERAALQLDNNDVVVKETHHEAWREEKVAGNHDKRANA